MLNCFILNRALPYIFTIYRGITSQPKNVVDIIVFVLNHNSKYYNFILHTAQYKSKRYIFFEHNFEINNHLGV